MTRVSVVLKNLKSLFSRSLTSVEAPPLTTISWLMTEELKDADATFIAGEDLDRVITKYRIRYLGGLGRGQPEPSA